MVLSSDFVKENLATPISGRCSARLLPITVRKTVISSVKIDNTGHLKRRIGDTESVTPDIVTRVWKNWNTDETHAGRGMDLT